MPVISSNGHVLTGKSMATSHVKLDGVTPSALVGKYCGGWVFRDEQTIAGPYAEYDGADIWIGEISLSDLSTIRPLYRHDATEVYGGGGNLYTYGDGHIRGSQEIDNCGCLDAGFDGAVCLTPGRTNQTLRIMRADGHELTLRNLAAVDGASFSHGHLLIHEQIGAWVLRLSDWKKVQPVPFVSDKRAAVLIGEYLVWSSDFGLGIRHWNTTNGLVVATGETNGIDGRVMADGLIEVVASWTKDESGPVRRFLIDIEQEQVKENDQPWRPMTETDFAGSVPAIPAPPSPEPRPMPEIDVTPYLVDRTNVVEAVKRDYTHLKGGAIVDQVAHRLNRRHSLAGSQIVFGRKARQSNGGDPNEDILAIRRDYADVSRKAMVDILIDGGGRDEPTWQVIPEHEEPGNGFWRPPVNADLDVVLPPPPNPPTDPPTPPPPQPPPTGDAVLAHVRALSALGFTVSLTLGPKP